MSIKKGSVSSNVIQLSEHLPAEPETKSVYELYPLPFLNHNKYSTWDVTPTGRYDEDCYTGNAFAKQFLMTFDGTHGWNAMLTWIVSDMIRGGTHGEFPGGQKRVNGIVIGFMGEISSAVAIGAYVMRGKR